MALNILRFRAWLEVGGDPKEPLLKSKGTLFPLTSFQITASLNAIPQANVTLASGINIANAQISKIHTKEGEELRTAQKWQYARIYLRNIDTQKYYVVFEGFVESAMLSYSFASTEFRLTIQHWLFTLAAAPCVNSMVHPSSASTYTQMLYFNKIHPEVGLTKSGNENGADEHPTMTWDQAKRDLYAKGENGLYEDMVENGVIVTARCLHSLSSRFTPWEILREMEQRKQIDWDLDITVDDVLEQRMRTGDNKEFPLLKIQRGYSSTDLARTMFTSFTDISIEAYQMNSLWAAMLDLCGRYGILMVPRAHELRFIPKWYLAKFKSSNVIKQLQGIISVNGDWEYSRSIGAVVLMPSSFDNKVLAATDATVTPGQPPEQISINNSEAQTYYGVYSPQNKTPGTLLVRQRHDWTGNVTHPGSGSVVTSVEQKEAGKDTNTEADGVPAREKVLRNKRFYDALAEETYWDEAYKGRKAQVVTPLSFDVCPGSTVRVKTGGDVRLEYAKKDRLTTQFVGYVVTTTWSFDTMSASANTAYVLSHVRDISVQDKLLEEHPIFDCPPFSHAAWAEPT